MHAMACRPSRQGCWLLPALLALASALECGEQTRQLTEISKETEMPSECMLSCTAHTYRRMLGRGDTRTVRFKPTTTGEPGEHCWPTQVNCGPGERLQNAYVVLPLLPGRRAEQETPGLQPTKPLLPGAVRPHRGQTVLSNNCGLLFDVTLPFSAGRSQPTFCVEVVPSLSAQGGELRCPAFLVTTWQQLHPPPT